MDHEQDRLREKASDLMALNAMALEENERSLHQSAERRTDRRAGSRLHRLADEITRTAAGITDRARRLGRRTR
ncbi:hypothetical protein [Actinoplanes sp. N902-109]|uniref:hypothetical protein n=1 Tax=Actinoplanes sp. (strain N902-109) TaxID=649831 RepID=UPI0003295BA1|nr:hypothetical protein [Actinoplanes sp. N902-109]AGL18063.1 hypothetical protein L083_4553 [Actinoplanes sp. N902-109]